MATFSNSPWGSNTMGVSRDHPPQADQDAKLLHHLLEALANEKVDVIRQNAMENYGFGGMDQWRIHFRQSGYSQMISYEPGMSRHMEDIARDCVRKLKQYMVEHDRVKVNNAYDSVMSATAGETKIKVQAAEAIVKKHAEVIQDRLADALIEKNAQIAAAANGYREELQARVDTWLN